MDPHTVRVHEPDKGPSEAAQRPARTRRQLAEESAHQLSSASFGIGVSMFVGAGLGAALQNSFGVLLLVLVAANPLLLLTAFVLTLVVLSDYRRGARRGLGRAMLGFALAFAGFALGWGVLTQAMMGDMWGDIHM